MLKRFIRCRRDDRAHRPVQTANTTIVHLKTRTRPRRSDIMPKTMPPITAPIRVAVTSEAPCANDSFKSAEITRSMKRE